LQLQGILEDCPDLGYVRVTIFYFIQKIIICFQVGANSGGKQ